MPDALRETAARFRAGMPRAGAVDPDRVRPPCNNVHVVDPAKAGQQCGESLGTGDVHALHCQVGGGQVLRHGGVARAVGSLVLEHLGITPLYEQWEPSLDRRTAGGEIQRAKLDVCYHDAEQRHVMLDITCVSPLAGDPGHLASAARRDGVSAQAAESGKYARYGQTVTPFVLELGGRPSKGTREYIGSVIAQSSSDRPHSTLGAQAWMRISCTLQRYVAMQLRRAEGLY